MQRLRDNGQRLHKAAMTKVRFISADGQEVLEVDAPAGTRLLDLAQAHGQPLEGTCEGAMACSTCHVVIDPVDFDKLPKATEPERSEEHTSELQSLMRISYAVFCLTTKKI